MLALGTYQADVKARLITATCVALGVHALHHAGPDGMMKEIRSRGREELWLFVLSVGGSLYVVVPTARLETSL